MHNLTTYIKMLVFVIVAVTMQACDDDTFNNSNDGQLVQITATTAFSGVESRAVYETGDNFTADDIDIDSYLFLLFDKNKNLVRCLDLKPEDLPYYYHLPTIVHSDPNTAMDYHAFLLGNVTAEKLFATEIASGLTIEQLNSGQSNVTIASLNDRVHEISRTYNKPKDEEKNQFTWSGYIKVSSETTLLNFNLNPNMAKITVTIKNESDESVIKSVRVKNIADKVAYMQNALNKSGNASTTNIDGTQYIKYDIESFDEPLGKGSQTSFSWYAPQNLQGDTENGRKPGGGALANETNLGGGLPDNATYVEIDGVRISDNVTSAYRVYPGIKKEGESYADMKNFDVKADMIYNITITITNDGIVSDVDNGYKHPDEGSTATAKIKLPENSNCYMIHPIGDRIGNSYNKNITVYELPIDRVNDYWKVIEGQTGDSDTDHALTADSKWLVEVIWQDIPKRVISFCDEYGTNVADQYNGEGLNPFCFKLENLELTPELQTYGNVLVGLKKIKSDGTVLDGYAWSWHLWITDYNPDAAPAYSGTATKIWQSADDVGNIDEQGYSMSDNSGDLSFTSTSNSTPTYSRIFGGNVQHYNSLYNWYWKTNTESSSVWDGSGVYADKWIMDRNIGSLSPEVGALEHPLDSWGMYYQYGRKDPFSYKVVYDISGQKKIHSGGDTPGVNNPQWTNTGVQATGFAQAIMTPNHYYAAITDGSDAAGKSWVAGSPANNNWYSPDNDPMNPDHSKYQKTLFDPCPPGWCVPSVNAFLFGKYAFDADGKTVPSLYSFGSTTGTVLDTDFKYAKIYANDLEYNFSANSISGDQYAHTAVTVHVDVNGTKNTNVSNLDKGFGDNTYNNTIDSYRDRERMFATLYSTTNIGYFKALKSIFPMQGRISGDGSSAGVLGAISLPSTPLHDNANTYPTSNPNRARFPNYPCTTGNQACLWTLDNGGDNRQGTLILFQAVTLNNRIEPRQEARNGRLFLRFHGYMRSADWLKSRGQNVRCIQEPN